jgi:hypothetical protein
MSKPVSRPNQVGRAIGYNVDIQLLLDKLKDTPIGQWQDLDQDGAFLEQIERAADLPGMRSNLGRPARLWAVVKMENGVPVMIDAFRDKRSANSRERFLRRHMRPEIDQVALFSVGRDSQRSKY